MLSHPLDWYSNLWNTHPNAFPGADWAFINLRSALRPVWRDCGVVKRTILDRGENAGNVRLEERPRQEGERREHGS